VTVFECCTHPFLEALCRLQRKRPHGVGPRVRKATGRQKPRTLSDPTYETRIQAAIQGIATSLSLIHRLHSCSKGQTLSDQCLSVHQSQIGMPMRSSKFYLLGASWDPLLLFLFTRLNIQVNTHWQAPSHLTLHWYCSILIQSHQIDNLSYIDPHNLHWYRLDKCSYMFDRRADFETSTGDMV